MAHRSTFPARRDEFGPVFAALLDLGLRSSALSYAVLERERLRYGHALDRVFEHVDALIVPAMPFAVPNADVMARADVPVSEAEPITFTAPFDYSGHPALTIPSGVDAMRSRSSLSGGVSGGAVCARRCHGRATAAGRPGAGGAGEQLTGRWAGRAARSISTARRHAREPCRNAQRPRNARRDGAQEERARHARTRQLRRRYGVADGIDPDELYFGGARPAS